MNQKYFVRSNAKKISEGVSLPAISKIVLVVDEENAFEAGDDTGYALEVYCPYGTQQMANDLLEQASGFVYTGYSAESVQLPPEAELGDGVVIGNTYGMLASRKFSFTPKLTENISAPLEKEVEHEYLYEGTLTKEIKRKLTLGASYYGTTISRRHGLEIKHYDPLGNPTTRVTLNSETLAFYNADGNKAFYYDSTTGEFKISSSIVVGLDEYEKKVELSTDISTYIDSAAGTAKIVSACSATYLSKIDAANTYETITAAAQIVQSVSDVQSETSLSADYGSGTIGSNVRALLQLVSNADTSSIEIKADKINFAGVTTFLRPGDNISTLTNNSGYQTSENVTTIIGNTITAGYIEALNISVAAAQITGTLTASQVNIDGASASNVTLSGNITSIGGGVGGWIIEPDRLYHPANSGNDGIGMYSTGGAARPSLWRPGQNSPVAFYAGAKDNAPHPDTLEDCYFGVLQDGSVYMQALKATGGEIGGCKITNGSLRVPVAHIDGTITAQALEVKNGPYTYFKAGDNAVLIAGFNVDDNSLYSGSSFSSADVFLCTGSAGYLTIGGHYGNNWGLKVGSKFGVNTSGELYATAAYLTGQVTATSGTIGSWGIENGIIHSQQGILGTYKYTTTGTDYAEVTGYMFTVLASDGIYRYILSQSTWDINYIVVILKALESWKADTPEQPLPI